MIAACSIFPVAIMATNTMSASPRAAPAEWPPRRYRETVRTRLAADAQHRADRHQRGVSLPGLRLHPPEARPAPPPKHAHGDDVCRPVPGCLRDAGRDVPNEGLRRRRDDPPDLPGNLDLAHDP